MTHTAHLMARCHYDGDELVNILRVSPVHTLDADSGVPSLELARDRTVVFGALYEALTTGEHARLDWGAAADRPQAGGGSKDYTLALELNVPGETLEEKVRGSRKALKGGEMTFNVDRSSSRPAKNRLPVQPIPMLVRLHVVGKPNYLDLTVPARTNAEAASLAKDFVREHRPDLKEALIVTSLSIPALGDNFLMHNQPFQPAGGFTNTTNKNLVEAALQDQTLLEKVQANISAEIGLKITDASRLLARTSDPLRASLKTDGPICWPEVAGKLEEHLLGHSFHSAPAVLDSRPMLAKENRIAECFEWRPRQLACLSLLEPTHELLEVMQIIPEHATEPDVQATLAGRMLTDLRRGDLDPTLYRPSDRLKAVLENRADPDGAPLPRDLVELAISQASQEPQPGPKGPSHELGEETMPSPAL